jgi:hypothetical protein
MSPNDDHRPPNGCLTILADFRALFIKMFLLTRRSVGQIITELILSCVFLGLLLGLRYVFDRYYNPPYQMARFRPQDSMSFNGSTANITYYYPGKFFDVKPTLIAYPFLQQIPVRPQSSPMPLMDYQLNGLLFLLLVRIYIYIVVSATGPSPGGVRPRPSLGRN